jgi:hypothetical protein
LHECHLAQVSENGQLQPSDDQALSDAAAIALRSFVWPTSGPYMLRLLFDDWAGHWARLTYFAEGAINIQPLAADNVPVVAKRLYTGVLRQPKGKLRIA